MLTIRIWHEVSHFRAQFSLDDGPARANISNAMALVVMGILHGRKKQNEPSDTKEGTGGITAYRTILSFVPFLLLV